MVNAGVYLVARTNPIFAHAPEALVVVAAIGIFTAILAASIAMTQTDIKRVLAYSTLSQLGYMFAALGVGAWTAAIFHLMTHGFFKGLLFLGSGSVIHAVHEEQDMRRMGGLSRKIPITYVHDAHRLAGDRRHSAVGRLLLEGRDPRQVLQARLLLGLGDRVPGRRADRVLHVPPHGADLLGRLPRAEGDLGSDPRVAAVMTVPLILLAIPSALLGMALGLPLGASLIGDWLEPVFAEGAELLGHEEAAFNLAGIDGALILASVAVAAVGIAIAWRLFGAEIGAIRIGARPERVRELTARLPFLYRASLNKWWFDDLNHLVFIVIGGRVAAVTWWFDREVVDGTVNAIGRVTLLSGRGLRQVQTGRVQNYALGIALGLIVMAGSYLLLAGR